MNHHPFFTVEHPIAMAHRGGAHLWPENTMVGFGESAELGFRFLETDLQVSSDGVLVCLHDPTLDRTTDGTGYVEHRTWEELSTLDAGHHFGPDRGHPWRGKGVRLPRLEEALRELPDTYFTLELKRDGLEELLVDLLERLKAWDRILVGSFGDRRLARLRGLTGGRLPMSAGEQEATRFWLASRVHVSLSTPSDALQMPVRSRGRRVVDGRLVRAARRAGKHLQVWTVNDPAEMHALLGLGVDGLITDRPDILASVMAERPVIDG